MVPSPPSYHKLLVPHHPITAAHRDDPTPSTSASHPSPLATFHTRMAPLGQSGAAPDASNSPAPPSCHGGSSVGLVLFGAGLVSKALLQSLAEETGCCLLVSGAIICSPPDEAPEMIRDALRAGKGVFCEGLPSVDRQTAEACFDEADRCARPLVCGFYKRFDPALQFLYKKVRDSQVLGRIHRISTISSLYPAASLSLLKASGGIFYNAAVHDIDIISLLLGESVPDTIFSLGHAFCADMGCLRDVDTVAISMKFPSGAIVTLDVSQHCTRSCDQRLEVHGSQGTLRVDNQNPLGITEHGTSVSICPQTQAERYRDAHRELLRHFLRTLKGQEPPVVTKEQLLWTIRVAAAAEQSWRKGSAVDLRSGAMDPARVKAEVV
ncbi:PREDICTED: inositol 2-dehydrogenase-like [Corvus brachyrhynchos]|uniref:inositol 2-dehydrogenase-like n=1 Tax=Corvus brachyrhynchos TaxID=85066 RepID=UPI00081632BD|nr:PREDICTED: inositol 2-dehydrogenase-like [Corvus brachyrhynchos]XP_017599537.1 PREDICTED: inositol 2-dehydrogenase-like [Corvus brachyrhynchos]